MTEQENRTNEQVANPEPEHNTLVTVLYRGGSEDQPTNPFMRAIAQGLRERGFAVNERAVDPQAYEAVDKIYDELFGVPVTERDSERDDKLRQQVVELVGGEIESNAMVIVDESFNIDQVLRARLANEDQVIQAYRILGDIIDLSSLEGIHDTIGPIIKTIREDEREPVIFTAHLGDHLRNNKFVLSEEDLQRSRQKNPIIDWYPFNDSLAYALGINLALDVPIIQTHTLRDRTLAIKEGTIQEALQAQNIKPNRAVLLVDHHLYYQSKEAVKALGLDRVEITRICPCCLGFQGDTSFSYNQQLEALGFRIYPISNRGLDSQEDLMGSFLDKAVSRIRKEVKQEANQELTGQKKASTSTSPQPVSEESKTSLQPQQSSQDFQTEVGTMDSTMDASLDRIERSFGKTVRERFEAELSAGRIPDISQIRREVGSAAPQKSSVFDRLRGLVWKQ